MYKTASGHSNTAGHLVFNIVPVNPYSAGFAPKGNSDQRDVQNHGTTVINLPNECDKDALPKRVTLKTAT